MTRRAGTVQRVARRLADAGLTVAVAESCTGGLLGAALTSVPGSSGGFRGGVIAYANDVKVAVLGVKRSALVREGAVSATVAEQMAVGARRVLKADIGVGITGIAGPDGGTVEKPVGLVYVAAATAKGRLVRRCCFGGGREAVRRRAVEAALALIEESMGGKGYHGKENE